MNFSPITRACLGTDAIVGTMQAFFDKPSFDRIPSLPENLRVSGMMVHLISFKSGRILEV